MIMLMGQSTYHLNGDDYASYMGTCIGIDGVYADRVGISKS